MEVSIKTKLRPFTVPNYVLVEEKPNLRQDGFKEGRKFHLSELDDDTLASLCNEFREEVFRKARLKTKCHCDPHDLIYYGHDKGCPLYVRSSNGGKNTLRQLNGPEKIGFAARPFSPMKLMELGRLIRKGDGLPRQTANTIPLPTQTSGGRMKIKFDRVERTKTNPNASGKTYNIMKVHGVALEGKMADQDWSTQFFANNQELAGQADALVKGDIVDVTMTKNGKFWNPTGFAKSSVPEHRAVAPISNASSSCCSEPNPRVENLKTAIKILGFKGPKETPFDYLSNAAGVADMIQDYVDKKGAFQFDKDASEEIPEVDEPDVD